MEPPATSPLPLTEAPTEPAAEPGEPVDKPGSLQEVFESEESPLLRFAYGLTGQREIAEDIVQEVFLRLHTHWDEVANPRAWLFRAARNLALNHLRARQHETPLENQPEAPASQRDPGETLGRMETLGTLRMLIAELPAADRTLIQLKYHRNLKYDEISRKTGLSVGNVGYKLHFALKSLADSLRRLGIESSDETI